MTCTNVAAADGTHVADHGHAPVKGTLFCRRCGYEASWNAGWDVVTGAGYREVCCPKCGARIA